MKIPHNVMIFSQGKTEAYEAFRDYFNQYKSINGNTTVQFDNTVSFDEKSTKMHKALLGEISRVSGLGNMSEFKPEVWASHPTYKWATFAVIDAMIDMILPETLVDTMGIYANVQTGDYGSSFKFTAKPRDLFVVSTAGHGKRTPEVHKQFNGVVTAIPVEHDIAVQVSLYRVLAGEENLADFAMKAVRSIETQMTVDAYNAFNTAMGNLSTGAGNLKVAGYTQNAAVNLAQAVTAYNMGSKAVFMGTQVALSAILPSNTNFRYTLDSDYVKMGYVQTAFGYDALVLPQIADWNNPFNLLLDNTRVYVISPASQKIVQMCLEGSTTAVTSGVYDNANLTQTTTLKKNWAAVVATNSIGGLITLS
jgi:hypothetical protein